MTAPLPFPPAALARAVTAARDLDDLRTGHTDPRAYLDQWQGGTCADWQGEAVAVAEQELGEALVALGVGV